MNRLASSQGASSPASSLACYILLTDQVGKTAQQIKSQIRNATSVSQRQVNDLTSGNRAPRRNVCLPGSLFLDVDDQDILHHLNPTGSKSAVVLKSLDYVDLYIVCPSDAIERVTYDEMTLLLGVNNCQDRLRIARDKSLLEDLKQLQMGDNVIVTLNNSEDLDGFLRYKGPLSSQDPAVTFGVELANHPGRGNSDGTHQKRRYFAGAPNGSVFVGAQRVQPLRHATPCQPGSDTAISAPLAIGERIVWMADNGPEFGAVRWIGILEDVSDDWTVGVEFDNAVGTGTGKYKNRQLFRAKQDHASLIPIMGLVKEADFLGTHTSSSSSNGSHPRPNHRTAQSGNDPTSTLPMFSEEHLDAVADRVGVHNWNSLATHLKVPLQVLAECRNQRNPALTMLRWWWHQGNSAEVIETSRLDMLCEALQNSGVYDTSYELRKKFRADQYWTPSNACGTGNHQEAASSRQQQSRHALNGSSAPSSENSVVDPEYLRSDSSLMREQEMVLSQIRQNPSNNSLDNRKLPSRDSRSLADKTPSSHASRQILSVNESQLLNPHAMDLVNPQHYGSASAPDDNLTEAESMNPLYDLNLGFVSATQVMDDRERRHNEFLGRETMPRAKRQSRAASQVSPSLTTLNITTPYAQNDSLCQGDGLNGFFEEDDLHDSQNLEVGSLVEVVLHPHPNQYGVIRWIGNIAKSDSGICRAAGLEMDEEDNTYTDGMFCGERYFSCAPGRAFFCPLSKCRSDSRFQDVADGGMAPAATAEVTHFGDVESPIVQGNVAPPNHVDLNRVCGDFKGIQGHHNSCYLDATLFSMFAFSAVFDEVLYRPSDSEDIPQYAEIQRVLKEHIVNPLRKNFFVRADRTMQLRKLLDKLSNVEGMMGEEKDPEEFLRSLLEQTLKMEALIKLTSGQKTYFYQIFVEEDRNLILPSIQQLFEKSMFQMTLRFTQAPACLIIQMPRYGKDFKMYKRIIPSLQLDISDVIEDSPRECHLCHNPANYECRDCYRAASPPVPLRYTAFCDKCMADHQYRPPGDSSNQHSDFVKLSIPPAFTRMRAAAPHRSIPRVTMELFAVLCINTSHYVAFVKAGGRKNVARMRKMMAAVEGSPNNSGHLDDDSQWLFFDSMAGRHGLQAGYNIPKVIHVDDFTDWVSDEKRGIVEDSLANDKILPEHIARLLGDAYMCFYQDPFQLDAL